MEGKLLAFIIGQLTLGTKHFVDFINIYPQLTSLIAYHLLILKNFTHKLLIFDNPQNSGLSKVSHTTVAEAQEDI